MKREETIKVLARILQRKEMDMEALQVAISSLRNAIREVELAEDDFVTTPHKGTFREEITGAMRKTLEEHGPLHRNVILEKVSARGLHIGGGIRTVGAYLSADERFKNVGKGIWALTEETEPLRIGATSESNGYNPDFDLKGVDPEDLPF